MKKLALLLLAAIVLLSACAAEPSEEPLETQGYEHKDFVSDLAQESCYLYYNSM